jgi:hypothetical protein
MSDMPFQLIAWLKREQAKTLAHEEMMVRKNREGDKQYMRFISFLVRDWHMLKRKEKEMVLSFAKRHEEGKNLSIKERSAIASMYMKYILEAQP